MLPVLSIFVEYSKELLHQTFVFHRDKGVTVGVLPGGGGVGWKGVTSRKVRGTPVACVWEGGGIVLIPEDIGSGLKSLCV